MSEDYRGEDTAPAEADEERNRALDAVLNFLSYRPRTHTEVRRKLAGRGFSENIIEAVIARLDAVGLVDDAAFVAAYVRDRVAHRPMGMRRMLNELYLKGISKDVALPIIESVLRDEGVDERQLARRVAEKKYGTIGVGSDAEAVVRRRLLDHLTRRGFGPALAREVVEEVIGAR